MRKLQGETRIRHDDKKTCSPAICDASARPIDGGEESSASWGGGGRTAQVTEGSRARPARKFRELGKGKGKGP